MDPLRIICNLDFVGPEVHRWRRRRRLGLYLALHSSHPGLCNLCSLSSVGSHQQTATWLTCYHCNLRLCDHWLLHHCHQLNDSQRTRRHCVCLVRRFEAPYWCTQSGSWAMLPRHSASVAIMSQLPVWINFKSFSIKNHFEYFFLFTNIFSLHKCFFQRFFTRHDQRSSVFIRQNSRSFWLMILFFVSVFAGLRWGKIFSYESLSVTLIRLCYELKILSPAPH